MKQKLFVSILVMCLALAGLAMPTGVFNRSVGILVSANQCAAPVLVSVTPSNGRADITQNVLLSGLSFRQPNGTSSVTSVFAVEEGNPGNVVQASSFVVLSANLIDVLITFGAANSCKTFRIMLDGPCGPNVEQGFPVRFLTTCPTPSDLIVTLKNSVTALVNSNALSNKQGKALKNRLDRALNKIEHGNNEGAADALDKFIRKVNKLIGNGSVSLANGQPLIDKANQIIEQMT